MMRSITCAALVTLAAGLGLSLHEPATAQAPAGWGTVKGQVLWAGGAIPERKPLNVTKDQAHCLAKGPLLSEDWVVNPKNKGIRWTLLWLAPMAKGGNLPIKPDLQTVKDKDVVLDQPHCQFEPHVLGMRQGQVLLVKNSAPVAHNVNWTGGIKNPGGNVIVPAGGSHKITDLKADRFPLKITCNIHPWMNAFAGVFDHPYFAVSDADGKFEIKGAPAGQYRLIAWQESVGWAGEGKRDGQVINIPKDGTAEVKVQVKP